MMNHYCSEQLNNSTPKNEKRATIEESIIAPRSNVNSSITICSSPLWVKPIMTVPPLFKVVPASMDATIHTYFGKIPFRVPIIVVILTEPTLEFCNLYPIG